MKRILLALIFLLSISTTANATKIWNWPDGARTGAQIAADAANIAIGLDDKTHDYYVTFSALIDFIELSDYTFTGTLDLSGATVTFGLTAGDIPDLSATYQPLDADLTTWAGVTPSANGQSLVSAADYAAMRTLLDLEAGTDFYSISAADAAFQSTLTNEAGLYSALSDVSDFVQPDEKFIMGATIQETTAADTTPDVSNAATGTNNIYRSNANGTITDFDDTDDHSEFSDGDFFLFIVDDASTVIDFSVNANIEGNAGVDFTGSATQITTILFVYYDARWNAVNFSSGFSDPTTLALSSINMVSGTLALPSGTNPTTDAQGEVSLDESDAGQDPLFVEAYDEGVGNASRIVGSDIHSEDFTILEPDVAQAASDDIKLKKWVAEAYPHGVTILAIHIATDGTTISDTFLFEEWDDAAGTTQSTIESIALSAANSGEDDGTLSDASMAADSYLNVNLDDASDDYKSVTFTIVYRINPGD